MALAPSDAPARQATRERVVAAATLVFIGAAVDAFFGVALLQGSSFGGANRMVGLVLLCVSALAAWAGLGLLRRDGTARLITQVLAFVGLVYSTVVVLRDDLGALLAAGVYAAILLLLAGPEVRRTFT